MDNGATHGKGLDKIPQLDTSGMHVSQKGGTCEFAQP